MQTRPPEHTSPHPPQFVTLVCVSTHPAPQSARLPAQVIVQAPAEHTSFMRHAFPHAPQLAVSLAVSVHWVPHMTSAPGQTQAPPAHASPAPQADPHPPQLVTLVCVSTQADPQFASGVVHCEAHEPWSQTSSAAQAILHAPQFAASDARFVQVPPHDD